MRYFHSLVFIFIASALTPSLLSAQSSFTLFGGYSYLRPPVTSQETFVCPMGIILCPASTPPPAFVTNRQNLNGWEISATYHLLPLLGLTADFSDHSGSAISGFSSNAHQQTYLVGPQISLPSRISPFAHALIGATHESISASTTSGAFPVTPGGYNAIAATADTGFAAAIGGGIDLGVLPHISIRAIQFDYLVTHLHGNTQNQPRISAGFVLHF